MPYITNTRANELSKKHFEALGKKAKNKGELNWMITMLLTGYMADKDVNYSNLSETLGAARDAADEFHQRTLRLYEIFKADDFSNHDPYHELRKRIQPSLDWEVE